MQSIPWDETEESKERSKWIVSANYANTFHIITCKLQDKRQEALSALRDRLESKITHLENIQYKLERMRSGRSATPLDGTTSPLILLDY